MMYNKAYNFKVLSTSSWKHMLNISKPLVTICAILSVSVYILLLSVAPKNQAMPTTTTVVPIEKVRPLASLIVPDEPVIVVFVKGEGYLSFRESEISKKDLRRGVKRLPASIESL
jgi:hypothetical protein